jgi:signal transduction histidine kinase
MKIKIRTKIVVFSTFIYTSLLVALVLLAMLDLYYTTAEIYEAKLNTYLDFVDEDINKFLIDVDKPEFKNFKPSEYKGPEKISVEIYDRKFTLLSKPDIYLTDEVREYFFMENRDRICVIGKEETCYYFELKEKHIGRDTIQIASTIGWNEEDMNLKLHNYKFFIIGMIPIAIILITFISFQISKLAFRPVNKMVRDVNLIRADNIQKRISIPEPKDEIRELGETLNKMLDSIEESMVSQKKFIENASHEIKTPLTILRTKLELLADNIGDQKNKEELNELLIEIDRLTSLSKSLLTLARLDTNTITELEKNVRLDEMIIEVTQYFNETAASKNMKLIPIINNVVPINGDVNRLKSVISNLVDNSIKYSKNGGEIEISLDERDGKAILKVCDSGIGISQKDLTNIFKRFFRSDEIRSKINGNGLGLSIVEEIVKQHNGEIFVDSELGKGTTITVELPA